LSDRFGGKVVLGAGVLCWSAFTLLTPPAAMVGIAALLLARVGMGLGEGITFPSIYSMFGRAIPDVERSRAVGIVFSAIPFGSVIALVTTPLIVLAWGWPAAFYSFGALGFIWWWFWHTRIDGELRASATNALSSTPDRTVPWVDLLRSMPVWAIIIGHFSAMWGTYVLLAWMPTYLIEGLGVDYAKVGIFAMVPSLCSFVFLNVAAAVTDRLIAHGHDTTLVRKSMQTIGFGGAAVTLIAVGWVQDAVFAIALMSLGSIFSAFGSCGFAVNHLDIAPRHAGVLMGLSNTAGTVPGVIGVTVSGWILQVTGSWALVFQVAAGVYVVGLLFYLAFASSKRLFD
jgi:ACS family sodium-dependent inorganic phosphate cotransporter